MTHASVVHCNMLHGLISRNIKASFAAYGSQSDQSPTEKEETGNTTTPTDNNIKMANEMPEYSLPSDHVAVSYESDPSLPPFGDSGMKW